MGVQIVEIAGQKIAMLPKADYDRLVDAAEDQLDGAAAEKVEERRAGGEEYVPAELVDRILAGESALRVWRQYRGMTLDELSGRAGIGKSFLSTIESGKGRGAPSLWRRLAEALDVSSDDILPYD